MAGVNGGPVEDYLARLRAGLRTPPARTAEIVAEAEDHLRESAAARQTAGLDEEAAQRAAVAAFGPVKQVIRAHRPTLSAYAATAGMRAWPLFGCYLLLSALLGGVWVWREHGLVVTRVTWHGNNFLLRGKPEPVQFAAILGGCAAAGLVVVAGFLVVRRGRRASAAPVPLARGLFPLAAGIALLGFAIAQAQAEHSHGYGWLPRVSGLYELTSGAMAAAALLGICCVLGALVSLAEAARQLREPAIAVFGARRRPTPVSAYAAEAALKAGQWLGSLLLLSALIAGVLLYAENQDIISARRYLPAWVCHDVALDHVVVSGPDVVAQQYAAGVEGDEIVPDRGKGDVTREVNALAAVTGYLPPRRALEVRRPWRDTAAQVVVDDGVVRDHDLGQGTAQPSGQDSLTLGVLVVNPFSVTWELTTITAAKMVCCPSPGRVMVNVAA